MRREALIVGINQYPFLKDTPTSKAKHLTTPATDAEAIAQLLEVDDNFQVQRLPKREIDGKIQV
jgi:Caspase domain